MTILTKRETWRRPTPPRKTVSKLTPAEVAHARVALRELRQRAGSNALLAITMRVAKTTIARMAGSTPITLPMVVRIARLAGVSIGDVLTGAWPARVCPTCGRSG